MTHSKKTRREFLGHGTALLAGIAGAGILPAQARAHVARAAGRGSPALVAIFLRGGADPLNMVVPYANKTYYAHRPTIAIPESDGEDGKGVLKLDEMHGLHPAMSALMPYWQSKQLATVLSVGSPHPTRSHFDAQDFMEYAAPGDRTLKQGWLNRYLQATRAQHKDVEMRGLGMQGLLPRSLRGPEPVLAVPRLTRGKGEPLLDLFDDVYRRAGAGRRMGEERMEGELRPAEEVVEVGRDTISVLRRFWDIVENVPDATVSYPRGTFGRRLALLAKVLKADCGLEVAALDVPSWDHHQGQGGSEGTFARMVGGVADALAAFAKDLGPAFERTTVVVMSEFGRTVAENGNRGTDHGRGGGMLVLGGKVAGGQVLGDYGTLEVRKLLDKRDLTIDVDFRTVFGELLEGSFGYEPEKDFFPKFKSPGRLGLFRS